MCSAIDNLTSCEIYAAVCFLHPKSMSSAEIHRELCTAVYAQNIMSEGTVRQWCRVFKDEWMDEDMFMMKSELVDHVSDTMDDLFKVLTKTNL
jgi:hypothetical protein